MKRTLKRTIHHYLVSATDPQDTPIDQLVEKALAKAPTVGERYYEAKDKIVFVNRWNRSNFGLKLVFYTFDPGYRPKKILQKLDEEALDTKDLDLDENEEIAEIVHLFIKGNHSVMESRRTAATGKTISQYLLWLLNEKLNTGLYSLDFEKLAKRNVVDEIKKHGVKKIILKMQSYDDEGDDLGRLYMTLNESLKECNAKKAELSFIPETRGRLSKKAAIKLYHETKSIDSPGDIIFILNNNSAITKDEFTLKKTVTIENDGSNNANSFQLLSEMEEAYTEWVHDGYIEDDQLGAPR